MGLTVMEIAKNIGMSRKTVDNKIRNYGIEPCGVTVQANGKKARLFDDKAVARILAGRTMGRPARRTYYRVSVFDDGLLGFVVTNAGLTRDRAEMAVEFYAGMGKAARMTPCG